MEAVSWHSPQPSHPLLLWDNHKVLCLVVRFRIVLVQALAGVACANTYKVTWVPQLSHSPTKFKRQQFGKILEKLQHRKSFFYLVFIFIKLIYAHSLESQTHKLGNENQQVPETLPHFLLPRSNFFKFF